MKNRRTIRHFMMKHLLNLVSIYYRLPIKCRPIIVKVYERCKLYLLQRILLKLLSKKQIVFTTINGIKYELDLNQAIDSSIYYCGCWEPETTAIIEKYVGQGMTVFDIGANIGAHSLTFAKLVGQSGKVIAFEPMSWAFQKLKHHIIELNNFNNVVLEKKDYRMLTPAIFQS